MVLLETSQEWQTQTSRLLQARPTTTRITTKYNIPNLESERYEKKLNKKRKRDDEKEADAPKVPLATLELKTYDPESGVVLKFKTNRAAEVGRLITSLGTLGRYMAALPVKEEAQDVAMEDAEPAVDETKDTTPAAPSTNDAKPQQGGGGGGNKKKKKGKK
ncbi:hypothetical protein PRZ48_003073 [Zasmidium cellare]|uniref:SRP9 domain-containing protein n=1 Tax=Zasmidium cellare TaxID=395010 RepID=A0ABR0EVI7_ZASCE|nr:hypothetical protein PRZ48_003073 [Zasmidium cellare]